jgi:hypothetical protein
MHVQSHLEILRFAQDDVYFPAFATAASALTRP